MLNKNLEHLASSFGRKVTDKKFRMTPKEIEILELLVKGESNKEIADALHISENTIKIHLRNIMEKLHLQNRLQIAVYAVRHGLVSNPPSEE